VELGAGTGMSGLSLMIHRLLDGRQSCSVDENATNLMHEQSTTFASSCCPRGPSLLVQTDANDDALELCRINRDANMANAGKECIYVKKLQWGKGNAFESLSCQDESLPPTYDTVFATDVLYDLQSLAPLMATASELLKEGGHFVLSHVPRASIDDDNDSAGEGGDFWQRLESIIIGEASRVNLQLASFASIEDDFAACIPDNIRQNNRSSSMILRPSLLKHIWGSSTPLSKKFGWQKMIDVGAAIFIFQKQIS